MFHVFLKALYFVDLLFSPHDTVDVSKLSEKMGVIDQNSFRDECNGKINYLVRCGNFNEKQMDGIGHFLRASEITVSHQLNYSSIDQVRLPDDKCVGFSFGKDCLLNDQDWLESYSEIVDYVKRPAILHKFADFFINQKLGGNEKKGGDYLAIHWRYDSDWLDMCVRSRGPYARKQNAAICKMVFGLSYDIDTEELFLKNIKDLMSKHDLKYIYMSTPPNNKDLLRLVKEAFGNKLFHLEDVQVLSNSTFYPGFLRNNYFSSFVEQEICVKSKYSAFESRNFENSDYFVNNSEKICKILKKMIK